MPWYLWRGIYNNKQCSGITKTINKDYLEKQLANLNIKFVDASIIVNKIKFNAKERLNFYSSVLMLLNSAYKNAHEFGTRFFEDTQTKHKIEKQIRRGKKEI